MAKMVAMPLTASFQGVQKCHLGLDENLQIIDDLAVFTGRFAVLHCLPLFHFRGAACSFLSVAFTDSLVGSSCNAVSSVRIAVSMSPPAA